MSWLWVAILAYAALSLATTAFVTRMLAAGSRVDVRDRARRRSRARRPTSTRRRPPRSWGHSGAASPH